MIRKAELEMNRHIAVRSMRGKAPQNKHEVKMAAVQTLQSITREAAYSR